jgi:alanine racemase
MSHAELSIDLDAIVTNWRALDTASGSATETSAVVKANAYGLDIAQVAPKLAASGVRTFFVASAAEGLTLRRTLGTGPRIYVLNGHMPGTSRQLVSAALSPVINSIDQLTLHLEATPGRDFGVQLDTGMNRLGLEIEDWSAAAELVLRAGPSLVMSHLACADEPEHPMNPKQLATFRHMTDGISVRRALSATGGILLGPEYHFDLTRPGIGLYGGAPFAEAAPVITLTLPVIQCRDVRKGETVGYANSWTAPARARIATVQGGYADGILRALSGKVPLYAGNTPCPLAGRVSMDLLTVDISHLEADPTELTLIGPHQSVDAVAKIAGTIGYEVLTSLSTRYSRAYAGSLQ